MRAIRNLMMAIGLAGGALCGTSCTTDMRDAVISGVYDSLSGTTTDLLTRMVHSILSGGQAV